MKNLDNQSVSKKNIKNGEDIHATQLAFDEELAKLNRSRRAENKEELKAKILGTLIISTYFISLVFSRSNPVLSAILGTSILFVTLALALIKDGKIDFNNIHKEDGFGFGIYVYLVFFLPVYYGIYLGYEDKQFEAFLLKNQCVQIESNSSEREYYCSKLDMKVDRSFYEYIIENNLKLKHSFVH